MFSESIAKLINKGGAVSAQNRVLDINNRIQSIQTNINEIEKPQKPNNLQKSQFAEALKNVKTEKLKYKVAPPEKASRGYINNVIHETATKHNVDKKLINAIIKNESNYNPKAISKAGAKGLMQLMPNTSISFGAKNPYDVNQNIEAGTKLVKTLLNKYRGNIILTLAAYNAGSGNVKKYNGVPPFKETQNYVKKVLKDYLSE